MDFVQPDSLNAAMLNIKNLTFDEILLDEELCSAIFVQYIAGFGEFSHLETRSFAQLAEELLPEIFQKNETVAKEMISWVGRYMYKQTVIEAMKGLIFESDDERKIAISERVERFHEARIQKSNDFNTEKLRESGYYDELAKKGREAAGSNFYSENFINRMIELENTILYPQGSNHPGKPNWKKITEILSNEFGDSVSDLTSKKISDIRKTNLYYRRIRSGLEG